MFFVRAANSIKRGGGMSVACGGRLWAGGATILKRGTGGDKGKV